MITYKTGSRCLIAPFPDFSGFVTLVTLIKQAGIKYHAIDTKKLSECRSFHPAICQGDLK